MTEVVRVPDKPRPRWARPVASLLRWAFVLTLLWWGIDGGLTWLRLPRITLAQTCGLVAVPYCVAWLRRQRILM